MLFNSYEFILFFLPISVAGFFAIGRLASHRVALFWLLCCSLFFYGWWKPVYLLLIIASIVVNYFVAGLMLRLESGVPRRRLLLILGLCFNLGLLIYFKYTVFIVDNLNLALGSNYNVGKIILPLAISFFTFQQIAYLVDCFQGKLEQTDFLSYCLFVTFFPQLIAGPIVHHKEMMPQFSHSPNWRFQADMFLQGLCFFSLGLFKKVIIADNMGAISTPIFALADAGETITFVQAWVATVGYTLQLYFDFSGYADMAIGAALMIGIRLPDNFNSPYKSLSIVEFWRRWHMTLSNFLRDYLYIALGGNRKGKVRRYANLLTTMLLGGLWHGAGWNFVVWGAIHGLSLVVNHGWRAMLGARWETLGNSRIYLAACWLLTIVVVMIGWVFFRAETSAGAFNVLAGMFMHNGLLMPTEMAALINIGDNSPAWLIESAYSARFVWGVGYLQMLTMVIAALIAIKAPNTKEIVNGLAKRGPQYFAFIAVAAVWALLSLQKNSEFLYFQF